MTRDVQWLCPVDKCICLQDDPLKCDEVAEHQAYIAILEETIKQLECICDPPIELAERSGVWDLAFDSS